MGLQAFSCPMICPLKAHEEATIKQEPPEFEHYKSSETRASGGAIQGTSREARVAEKTSALWRMRSSLWLYT